MALKICRMVTYRDCFLTIKSNDHLIKWFCEIIWQTKNFRSPLPQYYGHKTWQDKLKAFYLHFLNTYVHQIW